MRKSFFTAGIRRIVYLIVLVSLFFFLTYTVPASAEKEGGTRDLIREVVEEVKITEFDKRTNDWFLKQTANGKRFAIIERFGKRRKPSGYKLNIDGTEIGEFEKLIHFCFCDATGSYFYSAKKDGIWQFCRNEERLYIGGCDEIRKIQVSENGKHFACTVIQDGKEIVVKDGERGKPWDAIWDFGISDAGTVHFRAERDGKMHFVAGEYCSEAYDKIYEHLCCFSATEQGDRFMFITMVDGEDIVILDGKEIARTEGGFKAPALSPDGRHYAYSTNEGLFLDGRKMFNVDADGMAIFSPDSKHIAYVFYKGSVYVDGKKISKEYGSILDIWDLVWSPDSARTAFKAIVRRDEETKYRMVVDGEEGPLGMELKGFTFSPDGKRYAYIVDFCLIVDGKEIGESTWRKGSLSFSPDSKHVAVIATNDDDDAYIEVDGTGGEVWYYIDDIKWLSNDTYVYYATKSNTVYRIVEKVSEKQD